MWIIRTYYRWSLIVDSEMMKALKSCFLLPLYIAVITKLFSDDRHTDSGIVFLVYIQ